MCIKIIYLSLVLFLSFTGLVKGSCLEYGHSCWGAHGKRSGGKIYRSIEGQQSERNRDVPLTPDKVEPSELLNILLDRNVRMNIDDVRNPQDLSETNNENENIFDATQQRERNNLKDAFRKGLYFHYAPKVNDFLGIRSTTDASTGKRSQRPLSAGSISSNDYYQPDNYPSLNMDMEYLDLK